MKLTVGLFVLLIGAVLLILGISGKFNWETNIGLDAAGVFLILVGGILSIKMPDKVIFALG